LLPRFYLRAKLPLAAFVDADASGRKLKTSLQTWGLADSQIVDLRAGNHTDDFELEDILSIPFYQSAVVAAYPDQAVEPPRAGLAGKRTKYYEQQFQELHHIGFNKRRVAEAVKRLLVEGKADEETSTKLRTVTEAIWNALQRQIAGV